MNQKTILGVIFGGILIAMFSKKGNGKNNNNNNTGVDWTKGADPTISYAEANDIKTKIQAEIGYFSIDWHKISLQFLRLRNDKDVELLYKAWGVWDGPKLVNGDLFNALNAAYTPYVDNVLGNEQALKIIKQYCFSYGKYFKW